MFRGKWAARTAQAVLLAFGPLGAALAQSQSPQIKEAVALSTDVVPIERPFNIPQLGGGQYRITLTDLGALLAIPGPAPIIIVVGSR